MDNLIRNNNSPPTVGDLIQWCDDAVGLVVKIELQDSLTGSIDYFADEGRKKLYHIHWQDKNQTYLLPCSAFSNSTSLRWVKLAKFNKKLDS